MAGQAGEFMFKILEAQINAKGFLVLQKKLTGLGNLRVGLDLHQREI